VCRDIVDSWLPNVNKPRNLRNLPANLPKVSQDVDVRVVQR
jgi:hypothetical protein